MQTESEHVADLPTAANDTSADEIDENLIGRRIRQLRRQKQLSATDLADRAGVTKSLISQIELGRSNASVTVLKSIAKGLGVPLFTLFVEDRSGGELVRRDSRPTLRLPGSDIVRELLVPDTHRKMTLVSATFHPGAVSSSEPSSHQGDECIVVLTGQLTVQLNDELIQLNEGDSFYFDSSLPHIFMNRSEYHTEILSAISI